MAAWREKRNGNSVASGMLISGMLVKMASGGGVWRNDNGGSKSNNDTVM